MVTEVVYLIGTRLNADVEVRFLGDFASGVLTSAPVEPGDWLRIAQLVWRYRDMRLGTVDASVIALAERLGETTVATLDRRHFSVVRPKHAPAFTLVP